MERQSETILSQEQDTIEPVCVLSVNEIKSETLDDEIFEDDESSNEMYQVCRVSVADVLEEKPNLLEITSSLEKPSSEITVDNSIEEFAKSSKNFNKLVLINKELGTKTTVLPQENNEVTCINIDDLFIKQELSEDIDLSSVTFDSNYEFSNNKSGTILFDQKGENPEFEVVHSLDLNDGSQETEDDEEEEEEEEESRNKVFTTLEGVAPSLKTDDENYDSESSLMSILAHQFQKSNSVDRDDQTLKVLNNPHLNKREVFNELLIQINELE